MDYNYYTKIFKMLSNKIRLQIIVGLISKKECNVSKMVEKLNIPQPIVSQQLIILKKNNILEAKRRKNIVCYYIKDDKLKKLLSNITKILDKK